MLDDLLVGRGGGVVAPESVERLRSPWRIAPQEVVPSEQGTDRPARGAAQAHHLVVFQHLRPKKRLEDTGGEGRVATAALARYGHVPSVILCVQHPPLFPLPSP